MCFSRYIVDDDEDPLLDNLPPPRLFCDICDVFDQHDTDDCPMQTMSDSPPHSMYHGAKAPGGSDRPYCDNCEGEGIGEGYDALKSHTIAIISKINLIFFFFFFFLQCLATGQMNVNTKL